jgi:hypothetical protein
MFRDELDVLECRLTELEDCDVTHMLVESTPDHMAARIWQQFSVSTAPSWQAPTPPRLRRRRAGHLRDEMRP